MKARSTRQYGSQNLYNDSRFTYSGIDKRTHNRFNTNIIEITLSHPFNTSKTTHSYNVTMKHLLIDEFPREYIYILPTFCSSHALSFSNFPVFLLRSVLPPPPAFLLPLPVPPPVFLLPRRLPPASLLPLLH